MEWMFKTWRQDVENLERDDGGRFLDLTTRHGRCYDL